METARLTIFRPRQYAFMLRRYRIWVDGQRVAEIRCGEEVRLDLSPGEHDVVASVDFEQSNRLFLTVRAGDDIELEVGNIFCSWRALSAIYLAFKRMRSLYLRHRITAFPVEMKRGRWK